MTNHSDRIIGSYDPPYACTVPVLLHPKGIDRTIGTSQPHRGALRI